MTEITYQTAPQVQKAAGQGALSQAASRLGEGLRTLNLHLANSLKATSDVHFISRPLIRK